MTKFSRTHSEIWRGGSVQSGMVPAGIAKRINTAVTVHDAHARGLTSPWQDSGIRLLLLLRQNLKRKQITGLPEADVVGQRELQG